jgi:hypothetical protein
MKVKLAEGRRLRDPITRAHMRPDEVREVALNTFWRRRLRDGDVVVVEEEHHHRRRHETASA